MADNEQSHDLDGQSWFVEDFDLAQYFEVIGLGRGFSGEPTAETLAQMHEAHRKSLPFANLDVFFAAASGAPAHPGMAPATVSDQLVAKRRGGYCFEHATLFAAAAESLGFTVRRALGRVHTPTNTRTHMSVITVIDGQQWWCDPGFGFSFERPMRLQDGESQQVLTSTFSVEDRGDGFWGLLKDGELQHLVDPLPVVPNDVRSGHFITSVDPGSVFARVLMALGYVSDDEHLTIVNNEVTRRRRGKKTTKQEVPVDEVPGLLRTIGVQLTEDDEQRLLTALKR